MRGTKVTLLVIGLALLPASIAAIVLQQRSNARASTDRTLLTQNSNELTNINAITQQARTTASLVAHDAAFELPSVMDGVRKQCLATGGGAACKRLYSTERGYRAIDQALLFLFNTYGDRIGSARYLLLNGRQASEVLEKRVIPRSAFSDSIDRNTAQGRRLFDQHYPYFAPALKLGPENVYEGIHFTSPESGRWVIPFATAVAVGGKVVGVFEFELTLEGFRAAADTSSNGRMVAMLDRRNAQVVFYNKDPLAFGEPVNDANTKLSLPFGPAVLKANKDSGVATYSGYRVSWQRLARGKNNANSWTLLVAQKEKQSLLGIGAIMIALVAAVLVGAALALGRRFAKTSDEALHDALTGLANRRKLLIDLERALGGATRGDELVLALFDLDGFKQVNDTFGHPAGDALLARLGHRLEDALRDVGEAYRMGGDEFCLLAPCPAHGPDEIVERACEALSEHGAGYNVATSVGIAILPRDATEVIEALNAADKQLYANKHERKQQGLVESRF